MIIQGPWAEREVEPPAPVYPLRRIVDRWFITQSQLGERLECGHEFRPDAETWCDHHMKRRSRRCGLCPPR